MEDLDRTPAGLSSPAQQLALAVLEQALADLERRRALPRSLALPESLAHSPSLIEGVEGWFASDDTGWLFSFENVCAMVGIDAEAVRRTDLTSGSRFVVGASSLPRQLCWPRHGGGA